jgi:hypothetical protein
MRKQFIILLVTGVLLIMGWTIVEYLLQSQIQYQYQQISSYPLIVYSWDGDLMTTLQKDLKQYGFIDSLVYKTSDQAAAETIQKYNLTGAEEILEQKTLPNVLVIYLHGSGLSRTQKLTVKDYLDKSPQKDRMMIEYQNDIWNSSFQHIDQFNQIRWIVLAFIALVIYLVFLLKRLHYEHHLARLKHYMQRNPEDQIEIHDHYWINSLILCVVPVAVSFILYEIFFYSDWLLYSLDWFFFLIQLAVVSAATLTAYPFVLKYQHEIPLQKEED